MNMGWLLFDKCNSYYKTAVMELLKLFFCWIMWRMHTFLLNPDKRIKQWIKQQHIQQGSEKILLSANSLKKKFYFQCHNVWQNLRSSDHILEWISPINMTIIVVIRNGCLRICWICSISSKHKQWNWTMFSWPNFKQCVKKTKQYKKP